MKIGPRGSYAVQVLFMGLGELGPRPSSCSGGACPRVGIVHREPFDPQVRRALLMGDLEGVDGGVVDEICAALSSSRCRR